MALPFVIFCKACALSVTGSWFLEAKWPFSFIIFRRQRPMSRHKWELWVSQKDFFIFELCVCVQVTQGPEKPVLAVLTDRDLLLYPSLPENKESLSSPTKSHPLIATRLHHVKFFMSLLSFSLGFCFTSTWHSCQVDRTWYIWHLNAS